MSKSHAVALVDEVEMRVHLHHVDRPAALEGGDTGYVDRVVPPEHDRQRARVEDAAHGGLDVGVAADRIGMDDVGVAEVHDAHAVEVGDVVLVVVGAGVPEGEQGRGLADGARPEPGAGARLASRGRGGGPGAGPPPGPAPPLRAEVVGRAPHRAIGVDAAPVRHVGALPERRDPDEGQVEAPRLVSVSRHFPHPSATPAIMHRDWPRRP